MMPPVVLQIVPELGSGGVERGTVDVAIFLKQAGGHPIVASQGGRLVRELERNGIEHLTLPVASKNIFVMKKNIDRICQIIRDYQVDVVHVRSRAPAWSAFFAARKMGIPFLTTFHAAYKFKNKMKRFYNSIMSRGDRVIAISNFIAQHIQTCYGLSPERIRTIPRGIDLNRFNPDLVTAERMATLSRDWRLPDGKKIVLCLGRLTPIKGHAVLFHALSKLKRTDYMCVVVGSDKPGSGYAKELEQLATSLGLGGRVMMVGDCSDMPTALMLADVAVSPSIVAEGFGRTPVEAQAMGRPIIASNLGGMSETIIDGETGWLVPGNNAPALAQALNEALDLTPEQRANLASISIAFVHANFSVEQMCWQTLDVYKELYGRPVPWEMAA